MTAPTLTDPCFDQPKRTPLGDSGRIRVVQLLATGSNGGAQEATWSLVRGMDHSRYDVELVSLTDGPTVRRFERAGYRTTVIDSRDDQDAVGRLVAHLRRRPPHIIHNHMYRAEVIGTRAFGLQGRSAEALHQHRHSSRVRNDEDRELVCALTPHGPAHRRPARPSPASSRTGPPGHRSTHLPASTSRYDHRRRARCPRSTASRPARRSSVSLPPRAGEGPSTLDAWASVVARVPAARLLVIGEGSRRGARPGRDAWLLGQPCEGDTCVGTRQARPQATVVFTGRRDDVPQVTAALDVAVLPSYREAQGMVILEAMALRRPVVATNVGGIPEMIEDGVTGLLVPPHDAPALAAAIVRVLHDHPLADMLARSAHDMVHDRFCIQLMVNAIEGIYDAGARVARLSEAVAS
jgi:hypothetical protein